MKPTENAKKSEALAGSLFDEAISPLSAKRRDRRCTPYFPMTFDEKLATYFTAPKDRSLSRDSFVIKNGGDPEGIIDALANHWRTTGDYELAAIGPALKEIAATLKGEDETGDGDVNPLCYTLF